MAFREITIGVDHSMSSTGIAVIAMTDEELPILLEGIEVRTSPKDSYGERLEQIYDEFVRMVEKYDPDHIVREQSISVWGRNNSTQVIFRVVGVLDLAYEKVRGGDFPTIPIKQVKKLITGDGKADKSEMDIAVRHIMSIDDEDYFKTKRGRLKDDIVDAVGIALSYYDKKGIYKLN